jgi:RimJ/RimL family protein N-acetyltransferase
VGEYRNALGQPVGAPLKDWRPAALPQRVTLQGRYCRLEPLSVDRHAAELWTAQSLDETRANWTYLPYGPFESAAAYRDWLSVQEKAVDPFFFAVVATSSNRAVGVAAYLRIEAPVGSIEVGHLYFSPLLQRTPAATEAMYLMMRQAFDWGYRRYEWKCDSLNAASRRAAQRFGFSFEGIFRQARVVKGRNRDTAWFSVIDGEWPALCAAYEQWLMPDNFDSDGKQQLSLSSLTLPLLSARDER